MRRRRMRRAVIAGWLVLGGLLAVAAPEAEAQQGRLGQRFRLLGVQYEIVRFEIVGLDRPVVYRVQFPAALEVEDGAPAVSTGLATIIVTGIRGDVECGGRLPTAMVDGFPAVVDVWRGVDMFQGLPRGGPYDKRITSTVSMAVHLRLDAATCVYWPAAVWRSVYQERGGPRGDHAMADNLQARGWEFDQIERTLLRLLRWVTVER